MNRPYPIALDRITRPSELWSGVTYRGPRPCSREGCLEPTREGKPFCVTHVGSNPYVRDVLEALERAEQEQAQVRRRGVRAVDPEGLVSREIRRELRAHGAMTPPRLAKRLGLDLDLVRIYLRALVKKKALRLKTLGRSQVVTLLEPVAQPHSTRALSQVARGA